MLLDADRAGIQNAGVDRMSGMNSILHILL